MLLPISDILIHPVATFAIISCVYGCGYWLPLHLLFVGVHIVYCFASVPQRAPQTKPISFFVERMRESAPHAGRWKMADGVVSRERNVADKPYRVHTAMWVRSRIAYDAAHGALCRMCVVCTRTFQFVHCDVRGVYLPTRRMCKCLQRQQSRPHRKQSRTRQHRPRRRTQTLCIERGTRSVCLYSTIYTRIVVYRDRVRRLSVCGYSVALNVFFLSRYFSPRWLRWGLRWQWHKYAARHVHTNRIGCWL